MNAADVIAARLAAAGVKTAFGIPGGEVLTLVDALERVGIRFVLTKHENAAGFMAEGVMECHRRARRVLVATVGPGDRERLQRGRQCRAGPRAADRAVGLRRCRRCAELQSPGVRPFGAVFAAKSDKGELHGRRTARWT